MPFPDNHLQAGIGVTNTPQELLVGGADAVILPNNDDAARKIDKARVSPVLPPSGEGGTNELLTLDDRSSLAGDERSYYFLARGLCLLISMYLLASLIKLFIDALRRGSADASPVASCMYLFLENLLNTPSIAYLACGLAGAMISEVYRVRQGYFSKSRTVCNLAIGAITGLVFAYAMKAGLADVPGLDSQVSILATTSDQLPVKYFVVAIFGGYGGQRAFEWLHNKLTK